jgi:proline iminopeptidase
MILIGHSAGGTLAAHYLAAHPDRVERLVLSSPGPLDTTDRSSDRATAGLGLADRLRTLLPALAPRALLGYALLQVDPAAAHAYLPDAEADARNDSILTAAEPGLHCNPARSHGPVQGTGFYALQYPQSATAPPQPDVRAALAGLPTPALVLKGSCDYLSWGAATTYRHLLPHTIVLYLPGAGHNTYQDRPADVTTAVRAFLTDAPVSSSVGDDPPPDYVGPP